MIRWLIILLLIVGCASNIKKVISHYENGKIYSVENYKDGLEDGKWTFYNEDGNIKRVEEYKVGELDSN